MAKRFTIELLMNLAKNIGANPNKFMGTKTNISFLGSGPTKNPLFQRPLAGIDQASMKQLGPGVIPAIEDAMGFASAGKLNSIQMEILGKNMLGINKIINPPPLPTASVTPIRSGIGALRSKDIGAGQRRYNELTGLNKPREVTSPLHGLSGSELAEKTHSARATMIRLLDVHAGGRPGVGLTLREAMSHKSPDDLKWLLEGGGGAKGDPVALFAKYFGPVAARNLPSRGTPEVIEEFSRKLMRMKDSMGRKIDDPFFNPDDLTFAGGGLAEILQVPRRGYAKGRAVKTFNQFLKELRRTKASDLKGNPTMSAEEEVALKNLWGDTAETKRINKILRKFDITPSQALNEQVTIAKKYGNVLDDDLMVKMLYDENPQRLAEIMATLDEMLIMQNVKGMGPEAIIQSFKESWKRKPNASGGLAKILEVNDKVSRYDLM